jgi:hypothetical protein
MTPLKVGQCDRENVIRMYSGPRRCRPPNTQFRARVPKPEPESKARAPQSEPESKAKASSSPVNDVKNPRCRLSRPK